MVQEQPVRVERWLSAILAALVAGYSRLMHHDEEGTHAKLTALLKDAVNPAIGEHASLKYGKQLLLQRRCELGQGYEGTIV